MLTLIQTWMAVPPKTHIYLSVSYVSFLGAICGGGPCYLSVMAYHFSISAATSGTFSGRCSYCCLRSESLLFCRDSSDMDFRTGVVFMDELVVVVCVKSVSLERVVSCEESWRGIEFSCSACCMAFDMSIQTVGGVAFASVCIMVLLLLYKKYVREEKRKKKEKGFFIAVFNLALHCFACHGIKGVRFKCTRIIRMILFK